MILNHFLSAGADSQAIGLNTDGMITALLVADSDTDQGVQLLHFLP
jgi:hypothetical protein